MNRRRYKSCDSASLHNPDPESPDAAPLQETAYPDPTETAVESAPALPVELPHHSHSPPAPAAASLQPSPAPKQSAAPAPKSNPQERTAHAAPPLPSPRRHIDWSSDP